MRRLLLIDDECERWAPVIELPAYDAGWVLEGTPSIEDAEESLRSSPADCILLDLRFPPGHKQGQDALVSFRALVPETPVIILTASDAAGDIRTAVDCLKQGAWDYFTKSDLDIRRLLSEANRAADHYAQQRRRRRLVESFTRVAGDAPVFLPLPAAAGHVSAFGLLLTGIAERPQELRQRTDLGQWQMNQRAWQRKLIGGLHADFGDREFEIRYISRPAETPGTTIGLIGRGMGSSEEAARSSAEELWVDLASLLQMNAQVYAFQPITSAVELEALIRPFEPTHLVEIRRSGKTVALERDGAAFGFRPPGQKKPARRVVAVPLAAHGTSDETTLVAACHVLGASRRPVLLTLSARPEKLPNAELLGMLRRACEVAGGRNIDIITPNGEALPTPEQISRLQQQLSALQDEGGYTIRIGVASDGPIPQSLLNTLGTEFFGEDASEWEVVHAGHVGSDGGSSDLRPAHPADAEALLTAFTLEDAQAVMRLPLSGDASVPGVATMHPAFHFVPRGLPATGCLLGEKSTPTGTLRVRMNRDDVAKHLYILGQTGTGKSTLLRTMALSDIRDGRGICVIDPHGDLVESLLPRIPPDRVDDVIVVDPGDKDYAVGLNMLEWADEDDIDFLADEIVAIMMRMFDPQETNQIVGPQFQQAIRGAARAAMWLHGTVIDMPRFLEEPEYLESALPLISDQRTRAFFESVWQKKTDFHKSEALGYFTSKLEVFRQRKFISRIVGQARSTIDFTRIMDDGKILLVNLGRGTMGQMASAFLGMVVSSRFFMAAMKRQGRSIDQRPPFTLYIDEFQTFTTETVQEMIAEVRKFGLSLVLAHQNLGQIGSKTRENVLGNVGSLLCFRCGIHDAELVEDYFKPAFSAQDLLKLPNWNAVARLLVDNYPADPFVFQTIGGIDPGSPEVAAAVIGASHARYGRLVSDVDDEVNARLTGSPAFRPFRSGVDA